ISPANTSARRWVPARGAAGAAAVVLIAARAQCYLPRATLRCGWTTLASGGPADALEDALVPGDRADQDRVGGDLRAREDDARAELRPIAYARPVAEHDGAGEAHAAADANVGADPDRTVDGGIRGNGAARSSGDARRHLLARDLQVQGALDLVDVERHVVLEQRREDIVGPVGEGAVGEVVEDLGREDVDAAVAEVREGFLGRRLLLEAGDAPVAVVQHDAVLARVGDLLDRQRRDPARVAVT